MYGLLKQILIGVMNMEVNVHLLCHRQVLQEVSLKSSTGASHCCQRDDLPQPSWELLQ